MKKILNNVFGNKSGLLSLISEKTGKISFRRSLPILIITTVVIPDVTIHGMGWLHVAETLCAVLAYIAPEILKDWPVKPPSNSL